jgi:hypothetical protein
MEICRDFEIGREIVLWERFHRQRLMPSKVEDLEWLETRVAIMRDNWQVAGFTASVKENPAWFTRPASRVMVLYPEWPDTPYLKIDQEERLRRIKELSAPISEEARLASLADMLEPSNQRTGKKTFMTIAIPESLTHEDLKKAFDALLQINFPRQGKHGTKQHGKTEYSRPQGRGSEKSSVADDLNALAAFRLCKRGGIKRKHVIHEIKTLKGRPSPGSPVYGAEKALDKPLRRIASVMNKFRENTICDLEPIEPIEPLNLPQPDFGSWNP